jgi:3-oxoacyl-[acyl-carrier-protein] synthase II
MSMLVLPVSASLEHNCKAGMIELSRVCAGAIEAVFAVMSLVENVAPPTFNLERPEPGPWQDYLVRQQPARLPPKAKQVITNSFGFGGVNASLVFASPPIALDPVIDGTP